MGAVRLHHRGRLRLIGALLVGVLLGSGATVFVLGGWGAGSQLPFGALAGDVPTPPVKAPAEFRRLVDAYAILRDGYVDKQAATPDRLIDGAIRGMVSSLDDPYTTYLDPEELKQFEESLSSSFEGIGTEVTMIGGKLTVVSPIKGSPAEKAGIRPNDQILSVNGESLEGLSLQEAVKKIRGPKGTKVVLEIVRSGMSEPITITVVRDTIPLESVHSKLYDVQGVKLGWIEITSFAENTAQRFFEEMKRLDREGARGFVIDVRGNPGGYLEAVTGILEELVPREGILYQVEDRNGERQVYRSKLKGDGRPLVVLIDEGSASASEILAAALKGAGYPVVGTPSFGKGTVQVTRDLTGGGSIKLTVAKWLAPDGTWIHKKGVQPTVAVKQPDYFHLPPLTVEAPLRRDMNDQAVAVLQKMLNALGLPVDRTDGYFDASTEAQVRAFQQQEGLPVTGVVDGATGARLSERLYQKIKDPANDVQLKKALQVLAQEVRTRAAR